MSKAQYVGRSSSSSTMDGAIGKIAPSLLPPSGRKAHLNGVTRFGLAFFASWRRRRSDLIGIKGRESSSRMPLPTWHFQSIAGGEWLLLFDKEAEVDFFPPFETREEYLCYY